MGGENTVAAALHGRGLPVGPVFRLSRAGSLVPKPYAIRAPGSRSVDSRPREPSMVLAGASPGLQERLGDAGQGRPAVRTGPALRYTACPAPFRCTAEGSGLRWGRGCSRRMTRKGRLKGKKRLPWMLARMNT